MLLAINEIFVRSPMFDSYICLGAHGRGAGSEKDPSAAVRGLAGQEKNVSSSTQPKLVILTRPVHIKGAYHECIPFEFFDWQILGPSAFDADGSRQDDKRRLVEKQIKKTTPPALKPRQVFPPKHTNPAPPPR